MKNFEQLDVFQRAVELMTHVYKISATFPADERYGLTAQMRRAAVSVVSNVAEGQGRLTNGEWRQFLGHARGSLYELQALGMVAYKLKLFYPPTLFNLRSAVRRVAMPLTGLIAYVRKREKPTTDNREPTTHR